MVFFIFIVCYVQVSIKGLLNSIYYSLIYDLLFFFKGFFFLDLKLGVVYINILLIERFLNFVNMFFSIFMVLCVYVYFLDNESLMIRLVYVSIDK